MVVKVKNSLGVKNTQPQQGKKGLSQAKITKKNRLKHVNHMIVKKHMRM